MDSVSNIVQFQAEFFGLNDQLFQFGVQQASAFRRSGRGRLGYDGSDAWQNCQHALSHQLGDYFMRRVGIDPELFAERAYRGERIARTHLSRNNGLFGGINHLLINRDAGSKC